MENCLYVKIFENGKMYVGITNNFEKRMYQHNKRCYSEKSTLPLYNAMRKYSHRTEIWAEGIDDRELLNQLEIQTIAQLKEGGIELYNLSKGGEGVVGLDRSGSKNSMYGKHHSKETKLKISNALSNPSEITRNKIRIARLGTHHSEESKSKMSEQRKGEKNSNAKDMKYWETHSIRRANFKRTCKSMGWNFDDFDEIFVEYHIYPNEKKEKQFCYKYKGGR